MSRIKEYLLGFFKKVEETDCSINPEETIKGDAFSYTIHRFKTEMHLKVDDNITATVVRDNLPPIVVSEAIKKPIVIDAVSIFRCKEAFGLTDCVGAVFGKAK